MIRTQTPGRSVPAYQSGGDHAGAGVSAGTNAAGKGVSSGIQVGTAEGDGSGDGEGVVEGDWLLAGKPPNAPAIPRVTKAAAANGRRRSISNPVLMKRYVE